MDIKKSKEELKHGNISLLQEIIELPDKETIDSIISSTQNLFTYFNGFNGNNIVVLNFIEKYYNKFNNVDIFLTLNPQLSDKILNGSQDYYNLNNIKEEQITSDWFFELIKPTNFKVIDIGKFQQIIDKISALNGISLQEKANNFYRKLRNHISNNIDELIRYNINTLESLTTKEAYAADWLLEYIYTDSEYQFLFNYNHEELSDEENNNVHIAEKKLEQPALMIKLYVDMLIAELFEATPTVVYKDMLELLYFHDNLSEEKFLSEEIVLEGHNIHDIYYSIIYLAKNAKSTDELEEYAKKLKSINIKERFYDDMLTARKKRESLIKSKLYVFKDSDYCKDNNIQNKWPNAKIYDLRGEDKNYNLIIRTLNGPFNPNKGIDHVFDCYTYITEKSNHAHFKDGHNDKRFVYGYLTFPDDYLLHTTVRDSYNNSKDKTLLAREQTILADGSYPLEEINIMNYPKENGYDQLKPDYIIAYNDITEEIYNESIRLGIPIVILTPKNLSEEVETSYYIPYSPYYYQTLSVDSEYFKRHTR